MDVWAVVNGSPLPFGALSPADVESLREVAWVRATSPLPFGALSPADKRYDRIHHRSARRRLHCLSARCPRRTGAAVTWSGTWKPTSPLPFGALSPADIDGADTPADISRVSIAFRRVVPGGQAGVNRMPRRDSVSIAFRRVVPGGLPFAGPRRGKTSAPSPLPFGALSPADEAGSELDRRAVTRRLHCLSARCPRRTKILA